jgi:hypothetical protein
MLLDDHVSDPLIDRWASDQLNPLPRGCTNGSP